MKIPYNILIQIKMSVRPYFKGFTLIFFFYNCRKQEYNTWFFLFLQWIFFTFCAEFSLLQVTYGSLLFSRPISF